MWSISTARTRVRSAVIRSHARCDSAQRPAGVVSRPGQRAARDWRGDIGSQTRFPVSLAVPFSVTSAPLLGVIKPGESAPRATERRRRVRRALQRVRSPRRPRVGAESHFCQTGSGKCEQSAQVRRVRILTRKNYAARRALILKARQLGTERSVGTPWGPRGAL